MSFGLERWLAGLAVVAARVPPVHAALDVPVGPSGGTWRGAWGWAAGGYDPLRQAAENCSRTAASECRLYAMYAVYAADGAVVWSK